MIDVKNASANNFSHLIHFDILLLIIIIAIDKNLLIMFNTAFTR